MPDRKAVRRAAHAWCVLALIALPLVAGPPQAGPGVLIDRTVAATGSPGRLGQPFRLIARIALTDATGESVNGAYSLIAAAADRWREESLLPGREFLRVAHKDTLWVLGSKNHVDPAMLLFREAVDPAARIEASRPHVTAAGLHERRIGSVAARCFTSNRNPGIPETFCTDPSTGALVEERRGPWRIRYGDHVSHAGRFFPRSIRVFRAERLRVDGWIVELDVDPAVPSYLFERPGDSEAWGWCADLAPPRLIHRPRLESTVKSPGRSELKTYSAYAVVSPKGEVERLRLVTPTAEELRPAIVEALRVYRFQPATCGELAVPYEVAIDAAFE